MKKENLLEGASTPDNVIYVIRSWAIQNLEGKLLTLIETLGLRETQEKAVKDMIRPLIWGTITDADQSKKFILNYKDEDLDNSDIPN